MKIETGVEIGDELFYIIEPKNSCKYSVKKYSIYNILIRIDKDSNKSINFQPDKQWRDKETIYSSFINEGCFVDEKDAIKKAKELSADRLKEEKEEKARNKVYQREKAINEINEMAKKNNLKIIIE